MSKTIRDICALLLTLALLIPLAACGADAPEATADPHAGMVEVNVGAEMAWVPLAEGVPVSDFKAKDFTSDGGIVKYTGDGYDAMLGIDVSFYQGDIDWKAVRDAGVKFAMIRCGYRGSSEGGIFIDDAFEKNMEGALDAGLKVGVYFFSQSTGAIEAAEEAEYVLSLIKDYDVTMPVAFDWEPLDGSRAIDATVEELTGAAIVFCEIVRDAGYEPCCYFYRRLAYYDYDLSRLGDYTFWVGAPGNAPDFYYAHSLWQFSFTGSIPGIGGDVDLNLYFKPKT